MLCILCVAMSRTLSKAAWAPLDNYPHQRVTEVGGKKASFIGAQTSTPNITSGVVEYYRTPMSHWQLNHLYAYAGYHQTYGWFTQPFYCKHSGKRCGIRLLDAEDNTHHEKVNLCQGHAWNNFLSEQLHKSTGLLFKTKSWTTTTCLFQDP